jgi:hypothetical protein
MQPRTKVVLGAVAAAALARLVPHPPNFAPISAMALFAGAVFTDWALAFAVPLAALFLSDLALQAGTRYAPGLFGGWLAGGGGFYREMWAVYGAFVLIVAIGFLLRKRRSATAVAAATLFSSLLFFGVTNFATWLSGLVGYPMTLAGLVDCYVMALPFYKWTLVGDAVFATALFGGFALAEKRFPALRAAAEPAPQGAPELAAAAPAERPLS